VSSAGIDHEDARKKWRKELYRFSPPPQKRQKEVTPIISLEPMNPMTNIQKIIHDDFREKIPRKDIKALQI
jgi:hypothetical protein